MRAGKYFKSKNLSWEGRIMKTNYEKLFVRDYEALYVKYSNATKEIKALKSTVSQLNSVIKHIEEKHAKEIRDLEEKFQNQIDALKTILREYTEEILRLKSILNNNSSNSSNPPSKDQKCRKKANEYNSRKKSTRKKGGQKNHPGKTLTESEVKDMIARGNCEVRHKTIGKPCKKYTVRYVVDLKVVPVITEYKIYESEDKKYHIPAFLSGAVTYGNTIKTIAVSLYSIGVMSNKRIVEFINSLSDNILHVSDGTVYNFCRSFADLSFPKIQEIKESIINSDVCFTDATVSSINGVQSYIRNFSTDKAVYYYSMSKKNLDEMKKCDLLSNYLGTLIHDHETALYNFGLRHGECNVHLQRYLNKNTENTGNTWSVELIDLLNEMNEQKKSYMTNDVQNFNPDEINMYFDKYDKIVSKGLDQNKKTKPEWAKNEEKALLNRLIKYKDNHLMFILDFKVAFSNNMSERDLRKCKNRQKISGGFRIESGCEMYCIIMSIVETAKRNELSPFSEIKNIFETHQSA